MCSALPVLLMVVFYAPAVAYCARFARSKRHVRLQTSACVTGVASPIATAVEQAEEMAIHAHGANAMRAGAYSRRTRRVQSRWCCVLAEGA